MSNLKKISLLPAILAFALTPVLPAQTAVSISVIHETPGPQIPNDFAGYGFEVISAYGKQYPAGPWFTASNAPMIGLMKTLGVKSIRFGGTTLEESTNYPTQGDGWAVNDFANAIGANVIWGIPVGNPSDPKTQGGTDYQNGYNLTAYTDYVQSFIGDKSAKNYKFSTVFEIGNEPDAICGPNLPMGDGYCKYFGGKVSMSDDDSRFLSYLKSFQSVTFNSISLGCCSPASNVGFDSNFANDPNVTPHKANVGFIFAHDYPQGSTKDGNGNPISVAQAIDSMLSSNSDNLYKTFYNSWGPYAIKQGYKPRLEETNSISNGGVNGASNAFAASLWGLDYLAYLATQTQLAGVNLFEAAGDAGYNSFPTGPSSNYVLSGAGYGMLAFNVFGHGQPLPLTLTTNGVNLTAYSVLQNDSGHSECVAIINRSHVGPDGSTNQDASVTIKSDANYGHAEVMYLQQGSSNPGDFSEITLGGYAVDGTNGYWGGKYGTPVAITGGQFTVSVPHTSAAIVHFY